MATVIATFLTACTKELPKCSDEDTFSLVREIILDQIGGSEGLSKKEIQDNIKVELPRASAFDEKIKKYSCEAKLIVGDMYQLPITYESQLDDKNQHIVSVGGIGGRDLSSMQTWMIEGIKKSRAEKSDTIKPEEVAPTLSPSEQPITAPSSVVEPKPMVTAPIVEEIQAAPNPSEQPITVPASVIEPKPMATAPIVEEIQAQAKLMPSFNCTKASTWTEKTICSDPQLSNLDGLLMVSYNKALLDASNGDTLKAKQREWLKSVRNECKDVDCLKQAYTLRIDELKKIVKTSSISGEYERYYKGKPDDSSSITVRELADGKIEVKGNATWIGNAETGNINMGELDGSFLLDENKIHYTDGENEGCRLTIVFSQNALSISDDNSRCGGINVTFNGQYSKVVVAN